jgi:hypothetical protein
VALALVLALVLSANNKRRLGLRGCWAPGALGTRWAAAAAGRCPL